MAVNPSDSMQMEAVRRMQEMHGRQHTVPQQPKPRDNEAAKHPAPPAPRTAQESGSESVSAPQDISELFADKDRTLVLIVILLLLGEHSDTSLVMALVYLIL